MLRVLDKITQAGSQALPGHGVTGTMLQLQGHASTLFHDPGGMAQVARVALLSSLQSAPRTWEPLGALIIPKTQPLLLISSCERQCRMQRPSIVPSEGRIFGCLA